MNIAGHIDEFKNLGLDIYTAKTEDDYRISFKGFNKTKENNAYNLDVSYLTKFEDHNLITKSDLFFYYIVALIILFIVGVCIIFADDA